MTALPRRAQETLPRKRLGGVRHHLPHFAGSVGHLRSTRRWADPAHECALAILSKLKSPIPPEVAEPSLEELVDCLVWTPETTCVEMLLKGFVTEIRAEQGAGFRDHNLLALLELHPASFDPPESRAEQETGLT